MILEIKLAELTISIALNQNKFALVNQFISQGCQVQNMYKAIYDLKDCEKG